MPPIEPPVAPLIIPAGSVPLTALGAIVSPRIIGLRTGGPASPEALVPVDALTTIWTRGADLPNANTTLQPFTDRAYLYVLQAGTLTANREYTFGNANVATMGLGNLLYYCGIVRLDTAAFTVTVRRTDTTIIHTDPASPPAARVLLFVCSAAGVWSPNSLTAMRTP